MSGEGGGGFRELGRVTGVSGEGGGGFRELGRVTGVSGEGGGGFREMGRVTGKCCLDSRGLSRDCKCLLHSNLKGGSGNR